MDLSIILSIISAITSIGIIIWKSSQFNATTEANDKNSQVKMQEISKLVMDYRVDCEKATAFYEARLEKEIGKLETKFSFFTEKLELKIDQTNKELVLLQLQIGRLATLLEKK